MNKFRYVYSNGKEIKSFIYTIEEIEDGDIDYSIHNSRDFKLISRDRFTEVYKNGKELYENDILIFDVNSQKKQDLKGYMEYQLGEWFIHSEDGKMYCFGSTSDAEIISNTHIEKR